MTLCSLHADIEVYDGLGCGEGEWATSLDVGGPW